MRALRLKVINPLFVTAISWATVLALYKLQPVGVLYVSDGFGLAYVAILILVALGFSSVIGFKRTLVLDERALSATKGALYARLFFAAALLEVALKGLPPIFTGEDYTSWGISGLHGFINVLGLYVSYWYFCVFLAKSRGRLAAAAVVIAIFMWQVFVLNRAIIMLNLIGLFYILVSAGRVKFTHIIAAPVVAVFLMALIGDLRGMVGDYIFNITNPKPWAQELGAGFVWVVTYFTTATSNLMLNLEQGQSAIFSPMVFINEFFPNIFKLDLSNAGIMLFDGNFNASTIMRPSLLAFGAAGPAITIALLVILNVFNLARRKSFDGFLCTTFLASACALSCYENTVFTPWTIFIFMLSLNLRSRTPREPTVPGDWHAQSPTKGLP
jgi:hypothetical protein